MTTKPGSYIRVTPGTTEFMSQLCWKGSPRVLPVIPWGARVTRLPPPRSESFPTELLQPFGRGLGRDSSSGLGPWAVAVSCWSPRAGQDTGRTWCSGSGQRGPQAGVQVGLGVERPVSRWPRDPGSSPPRPERGAWRTTSRSRCPALSQQVEERGEVVEPLQVVPLNELELAGVEAPDLCPGEGVGWGPSTTPP